MYNLYNAPLFNDLSKVKGCYEAAGKRCPGCVLVEDNFGVYPQG